MERRFQLRLEELLEDAVLDPRIPEGMLDRLEQFVEPFAARLTRPSPNHDRKTGSDSPRIPKACRPRSSSRCQSLPRRARRS